MQLTVDSHEPLADVLRVISALYDVTLTSPSAGSAAGGENTPTSRASRRPSRGSVTGRKASADQGAASAKIIREWASQNGFEVNARGSLPASVRHAYEAAKPS